MGRRENDVWDVTAFCSPDAFTHRRHLFLTDLRELISSGNWTSALVLLDVYANRTGPRCQTEDVRGSFEAGLILAALILAEEHMRHCRYAVALDTLTDAARLLNAQDARRKATGITRRPMNMIRLKLVATISYSKFLAPADLSRRAFSPDEAHRVGMDSAGKLLDRYQSSDASEASESLEAVKVYSSALVMNALAFLPEQYLDILDWFNGTFSERLVPDAGHFRAGSDETSPFYWGHERDKLYSSREAKPGDIEYCTQRLKDNLAVDQVYPNPLYNVVHGERLDREADYMTAALQKRYTVLPAVGVSTRASSQARP